VNFRIRSLAPAMVAGIAASAALAACSPTGPAGRSADVSDYTDGEYSADGQYGSLPSSIGVTVALVDDVITDVTVAPHATDPTSLDLQNRFADAVRAVVVGRDIDEIHVDRLAGSSRTPDGFNAALERIKTEAAKQGNG
jgi:hypothetical protein